MTALCWFEGYSGAPVSFDGPLLYVVTTADVDYWIPRLPVLRCATWGEVRALGLPLYCEVLELVGHGSYDQMLAHFRERDAALSQAPPAVVEVQPEFEDLPRDGDAFNAHADIGMCAEGDWPPSLYSMVATAVPEGILEQYGEWWFTTMNGMYAVLDASRKDAVLRALIDEGHTLVEDPRIKELTPVE
jgi:hypothetical protein